MHIVSVVILTNPFAAADHPYFHWYNLTLGSIAGGTAATITYPTDLIRRRMQLQGRADLGVNLPKFTSTFQCVRWTVQTEGAAGLYQGLGACLLKVMPAAAISFMIYEFMRIQLGFKPPNTKMPSAG